MTALPAPTRIGRTAEVQERTLLDEMRLEIRVLRLEGTELANHVRAVARALQHVGVRDDSIDTVQLAADLEARALRHLRQRR